MARNNKVSRVVGIEKMLSCSGECNDKLLPVNKFRIRKRKGTDIEYYSSRCRECENTQSKGYYQKVKDDPDFIINNRARCKAHRDKDVKKTKQREKVRRQKPAYKKWVKRYYKKHKKKIQQQQKARGSRWHQNRKEKVTDKYAIDKLKAQGYTAEQINANASLIEIKRTEILLSRVKKKVKRRPVGKSKVCNRCKFPKDLSQFYTAGKCVDGSPKYNPNCITCCSELGAASRKEKKNGKKKNTQ